MMVSGARKAGVSQDAELTRDALAARLSVIITVFSAPYISKCKRNVTEIRIDMLHAPL